MPKCTPYRMLNRYDLIGLYRLGIFDPSGGYEGTYFQKAWESMEIPDLCEDMIFEKNEKLATEVLATENTEDTENGFAE